MLQIQQICLQCWDYDMHLRSGGMSATAELLVWEYWIEPEVEMVEPSERYPGAARVVTDLIHAKKCADSR